MTLGAVLGNTGGAIRRIAPNVGRDTDAPVKDLHRGCGEARIQLFSGELVRHAVQVPIDVNVVIDVGADRLPLRKLVWLGGQRL